MDCSSKLFNMLFLWFYLSDIIDLVSCGWEMNTPIIRRCRGSKSIQPSNQNLHSLECIQKSNSDGHDHNILNIKPRNPGCKDMLTRKRISLDKNAGETDDSADTGSNFSNVSRMSCTSVIKRRNVQGKCLVDENLAKNYNKTDMVWHSRSDGGDSDNTEPVQLSAGDFTAPDSDWSYPLKSGLQFSPSPPPPSLPSSPPSSSSPSPDPSVSSSTALEAEQSSSSAPAPELKPRTGLPPADSNDAATKPMRSARAAADSPPPAAGRPSPMKAAPLPEARLPAHVAPPEYCDTRPMVCKEFQETGSCRCAGASGPAHLPSPYPHVHHPGAAARGALARRRPGARGRCEAGTYLLGRGGAAVLGDGYGR
jgi:hypothetical protein